MTATATTASRMAVDDEDTFLFPLLLDLFDEDGTTLSYEKEILRPHVLRATNQYAYGGGGGGGEIGRRILKYLMGVFFFVCAFYNSGFSVSKRLAFFFPLMLTA